MQRPYLVLDLTLSAKLRGAARAAFTGTAIGYAAKMIAGLALPEAAAVVIGIGAFREAADASVSAFNARLQPGDIVVREKAPPQFTL